MSNQIFYVRYSTDLKCAFGDTAFLKRARGIHCIAGGSWKRTPICNDCTMAAKVRSYIEF